MESKLIKISFAIIIISTALALFRVHQVSNQLGTINQSIQPFYPNPVETPGYINSEINQNNIKKTICNPNWTTKSIRPPSSYTSKLKQKQLNNGYAYNNDKDPSHYEEDHLISLVLGGHPTDPRNLWPQPYDTKPVGARDKDKIEIFLHKQVCNGTITLEQAQESIRSNWYQVYLEARNTFGSDSLVDIDQDDD